MPLVYADTSALFAFSIHFHVSAARRLHLLSGLDEFWTCDAEQAKAAKTAGLRVRLFAL